MTVNGIEYLCNSCAICFLVFAKLYICESQMELNCVCYKDYMLIIWVGFGLIWGIYSEGNILTVITLLFLITLSNHH